MNKDGTECGHSLNGKFTTNLKSHLKKCHTNEYSLFENEEKNRKQEKIEKKSKVHKERASSFKYQAKYRQQLTLEENLHMANNKKGMRLLLKSCLFIGATNSPLSLYLMT